jgi:hypothetical protein
MKIIHFLNDLDAFVSSFQGVSSLAPYAKSPALKLQRVHF